MDPVAEPPALPLDLGPVDPEGDACRLRQREWLWRFSQLANGVLVKVRRAPGYRYDAAISELQYLLRIQVNVSHHPLDRASVRIAILSLVKGDGAKDSLPLLFRKAELPRGPWIELNILEIINAAFANGFLPCGILADHLLQQSIVLVHEGRFHALHRLAGQNYLSIQIDHRLSGRIRSPLINHNKGFTPYRSACFVTQHLLFGRLIEDDNRKPAGLGRFAVVFQHRNSD